MSENILLTITMLVSDRVSTIEKCMESLKSLREVVPSELIVVDTAGNQTCMDIVQKYTDKIISFKWCDDFAAARNAGVTKARGQWLMYLDDDEWFESTAELEHFFLSENYRKYRSATYIQRNYSDPEGSQWKDSDVMRLAKREPGICFYGKIHEFFSPLEAPTCYLKDYVHHYGYAYQSRQEQVRHSWRNIRLLLEMRSENPWDYHATAQLVQEYFSAEEYFSALELCRELRNTKGCWDLLASARYSTYAVMMEMKIYHLQQRFNDGYKTGDEILAQQDISSRKPFTVLARGIAYNQMASFCCQLEKYGEALVYIDKFTVCLKEWENFPNRKELDGFSACAVYTQTEEVRRLALMKLHIYVLQKNWKKAREAFLAIDWQEETAADLNRVFLPETPEDLCELLLSAPIPEYMEALEALYRQKDMRPFLYKAVDRLDFAKKTVLLTYLRRLPLEDPHMCFYHLLYAGSQNDITAAIPVMEKMQQENYPFFAEDESYWDSLLTLNLKVSSYMTSISPYNFMEAAKKLFEIADYRVCEKAYQCLIKGLGKTDIRFLYLNGLMLEKKLSGKEDFVYTVDEIWDNLLRLAQCYISCAATLYREEVFMGDLISALPPAYQFGWFIMQANALKNQNKGLFLQKVADAAKAYPTLKELCKKVIREG